MDNDTPNYVAGIVENALKANQMADIINTQIDNSILMDDFRHYYQGDIKIDGNWQHKREALMNDKGVLVILMQLQSGLEKSAILSKMQDVNTKNNFMYYFANDLYDILVAGWKDFNIEPKMINAIASPIINLVDLNVSRSIKAMTAGLLNKNIQHQEIDQFIHNEGAKKQRIKDLGEK